MCYCGFFCSTPKSKVVLWKFGRSKRAEKREWASRFEPGERAPYQIMERRGGISRDRLVQPAKLGHRRIPGLREYITARWLCRSSSSGASQVCMQMSDSAGILNVRIKPSEGNSLAAHAVCDNDAVLFQFLLVSQVSRRPSKILFLAQLLMRRLIHKTWVEQTRAKKIAWIYKLAKKSTWQLYELAVSHSMHIN